MSQKIKIENGIEIKCPHCKYNKTICIKNDTEYLFINVYNVHIKNTPNGQTITAKCRSCDKVINIA